VSAQVAVGVAPPSQAPARSYTDVLHELLAITHDIHQFAPGHNRPSPSFEEELPAIEAAFRAATTRVEAIRAVRAFQNALRDDHCTYRAPRDLTTHSLDLGIDLFIEPFGDGLKVFIEKVDPIVPPGLVSVGDEILSIDGQALSTFAFSHRLDTNAGTHTGVWRGALERISTAVAPIDKEEVGTKRVLRLRGVDQKEHQATLAFVDSHDLKNESPRFSLDEAKSVTKLRCAPKDDPAYGPYELTAAGFNVCVYESKSAPYRDYPIVRFPSFYYADATPDNSQLMRSVHGDWEILRHHLSGKRRGVLLDVRENQGGNNPFIFLSWFTDKPLTHERVHLKVAKGLPEGPLRRMLFGGDKVYRAYRDAESKSQPYLESFFLCDKGDCEHEKPAQGQQVTSATVAMLIGPECVSSCDTFALAFEHDHLGPLVGEQPASAFTVNRYSFHVEGLAHEDLGDIQLAAAYSTIGHDSETSIEGAPRHLDVEVRARFSSRSKTDKVIVDAGIAAIEGWNDRQKKAGQIY
jgi:hypothetical protein